MLKMLLLMYNIWNILKFLFFFNKVNDKLNGIWKIFGYGIFFIFCVLVCLFFIGILILNVVLFFVC